MTAIVISEGERGWVQELVRALEQRTGCAAMDDGGLIKKASDGRRGSSLLLSWSLFGAHPLADRVVMERKCGKALVCQTMVAALERGVRIFQGDLGHLLQRFPVSVFRVLIAGESGGERRRKRLFGVNGRNHRFYDMYLPGESGSAEGAAQAILERSAVALGDPGRPLSEARLRLASHMAGAELDLVRRGVDAEFWGPAGELTVWHQSSLSSIDLQAQMRCYALGDATCKRGTPPSIFETRVFYTLRMRVEGERQLGDVVAAVSARNGGRLGTAEGEVVLYSGPGWGGVLVVDIPGALADPEEVVWRLMALHPGRRLMVPAPRYAWLATRMGLDAGCG